MPKQLLGPGSSYAYVVNFVQGAGLLAMPYAFQQAGVILSVSFLFVVSFFAMLTINWELESLSRANLYNYFQTFKKKTLTTHRRPSLSINNTPSSEEYEHPIPSTEDVEYKPPVHMEPSEHAFWSLKMVPFLHINSQDSIDMNVVCGIFIRPWMKIAYDICLGLYSYSGLCVYTTIFAGSVTATIPFAGLTSSLKCNVYVPSSWTNECETAYILYTVIFGVIMITLMLHDLSEQGFIQTFLTAFAFFCIFIMLLTTIIAAFDNPYEQNDRPDSPPFFIKHPPLFVLSGFGFLVSTGVFSQMCHQSIPLLTRMMSKKHAAAKTYFAALFTTVCFYSLVGTLTSLYFGDQTRPEITLNWLNYSADNSKNGFFKSLAAILRVLITLYPALPISAAFPMFATVLGDSLVTWVPIPVLKFLSIPIIFIEKLSAKLRGNTQPHSLVQNNFETTPLIGGSILDDVSQPLAPFGSKKMKKSMVPDNADLRGMTTTEYRHSMIACRFLAAVPPLLAGGMVRDLSKIVGIPGLFGFFLMFLFPAAMEFYSMQWVRENSTELYDMILRSDAPAYNQVDSSTLSGAPILNEETLLNALEKTQYGGFVSNLYLCAAVFCIFSLVLLWAVYYQIVAFL